MMNNLSEDVTKHAAYQTADDVAAICNDLFKTFQLNYFDYVRVYPDNSCLILISDKIWYQHFFENKYKIGGTIIDSGIHLWDGYYVERAIEDHAKYFNHYNGVTICTKNKNYIEYFDLAAPKENHSIIEFYLNNVNLLNQFLFCFKDKAIKLLAHANQNRFVIPNTMRGKSLQFAKYEDFCESIKNSKKCLNFRNKDIIFTKREYECITLLARGKTMKATAQILNISAKTVEEYLSNARNKTGYLSKLKLIEAFMNNFANYLFE